MANLRVAPQSAVINLQTRHLIPQYLPELRHRLFCPFWVSPRGLSPDWLALGQPS